MTTTSPSFQDVHLWPDSVIGTNSEFHAMFPHAQGPAIVRQYEVARLEVGGGVLITPRSSPSTVCIR